MIYCERHGNGIRTLMKTGVLKDGGFQREGVVKDESFQRRELSKTGSSQSGKYGRQVMPSPSSRSKA
jgi:hypothetical protein